MALIIPSLKYIIIVLFYIQLQVINVTIHIYIVHKVPKLSDLNSKVVPHHAVHWKDIGIELGLAKALLDAIADNNTGKIHRSQECLKGVLEKWLLQDGPSATWNKLEHAITNVQRAELVLDPLEMSMFKNCNYGLLRRALVSPTMGLKVTSVLFA